MTRLAPLQNNSQELNTGDSAEFGAHPKEVVDAVNALFSQAGATAIDFGAFPGSYDASLVITGQSAIVAGSIVQAWLVATATADHSADEHWVDPPFIVAGEISPGVGFTIRATARDGGRAFGLYTVHWKWS